MAIASWRASVERKAEISRDCASAQCKVSSDRLPVPEEYWFASPTARWIVVLFTLSIAINFRAAKTYETEWSVASTWSSVASWRKTLSRIADVSSRSCNGVKTIGKPAVVGCNNLAVFLQIIEFHQTSGVKADHKSGPATGNQFT